MLVDISTFPVNLYRSMPMPSQKMISGKAGTLSQKLIRCAHRINYH